MKRCRLFCIASLICATLGAAGLFADDSSALLKSLGISFSGSAGFDPHSRKRRQALSGGHGCENGSRDRTGTGRDCPCSGLVSTELRDLSRTERKGRPIGARAGLHQSRTPTHSERSRR